VTGLRRDASSGRVEDDNRGDAVGELVSHPQCMKSGQRKPDYTDPV